MKTAFFFFINFILNKLGLILIKKKKIKGSIYNVNNLRLPTLSHSLALINKFTPDAGKNIIDIGGQTGTDFLISNFKNSFHHIFEPVIDYKKTLEVKYKKNDIAFKFYHLALSDQNKKSYIHKISQDNSGNITHGHIYDEEKRDMKFLVGIDLINIKTLDSIEFTNLQNHQYIVKLDVDGLEEKIIKGGKNILSNASFIIIECSLQRDNIFERFSLIRSLGYKLFDICDHGYYFNNLSIVDLVFINR